MRLSFEGVYGEITTLPGCTQIGVSHNVFVDPSRRGQGWGTEANLQRTAFMRDNMGYDYALCTVESTNEAQQKIMSVNGWKQLSYFVSRKTGHTVILYGKELT